LKFKDKTISKIELFNEFLKVVGSVKTLEDFFTEILEVLNIIFPFDLITILTFNTISQEINYKTTNISPLKIKSKPLGDSSTLVRIAKENGVKQLIDWQKQKELQKLLEVQKIKSTIIIPLKTDKFIFGFLILGDMKNFEFSSDELKLFETLGYLISCNIDNFLTKENLNEQNIELKEVTRQMRHDFANDLQSIAMALELLASTDLNEDQQKYVKILDKAKISAVEKIRQLKQLKIKYETKVDPIIGIPIE